MPSTEDTLKQAFDQGRVSLTTDINKDGPRRTEKGS